LFIYFFLFNQVGAAVAVTTEQYQAAEANKMMLVSSGWGDDLRVAAGSITLNRR
jgi:hypothetical protein